MTDRTGRGTTAPALFRVVAADGQSHYGTLEHEGPVVAIVNTPAGRVLVTVDELNRWNDRPTICPLHGADCEAWS